MTRSTLTKRIVVSATPRSRPYELPDAQVRGLLLRVQPSGHKAWVVSWARGKRRTLGSVEHLSLDQARQVARQAVAEFVQDGLPALAKKTATSLTLEQFVEQHYAPWAERELKGGVDSLRRIRQAFPKALPLSIETIDQAWMSAWWTARLQQPIRKGSSRQVSRSTASRNIATLRSVFSKAVDWGHLESNPLLKLKIRSAKSNAVVRYLSEDEGARLRSALRQRDRDSFEARESANRWRAARGYPVLPSLAAGEYCDHLSPIVLLALNTGMRRGELLGLKWSDVDLEACIVSVRKENAKSGKARHIPLNRESRMALQAWRLQNKGSADVFDVCSIKSSWERLLRKAQISNFRFHDLRHDFASKLVMAGVDLNTVRELLGHSDLTMTLRYAHLAPEHLAAAVGKLDAA